MRDYFEYCRALFQHGLPAYTRVRGWIITVLVLVPALITLIGLQYAWPDIPNWVAPVLMGSYALIAALLVWPFKAWRSQRDKIRELTAPGYMTIWELFYKFDPDPISKKEEIGAWLVDRLASEELLAVGRRGAPGTVGRMIQIPTNYWQFAKWTYRFLEDDVDDKTVTHVTGVMSETKFLEYSDVQFDRSRATKLIERDGPAHR